MGHVVEDSSFSSIVVCVSSIWTIARADEMLYQYLNWTDAVYPID